MNDPWLTLEKHEIQGADSCIAWSIEYLAKVGGTMPLGEYPIQMKHSSGLGFGAEAAKLLEAYNVKAQEAVFDWADFEQTSKACAMKGKPLVFALPHSARFTMQPPIGFLDMNTHAAVAVHDAQAPYVMRQHAVPDLIAAPIHEIYDFVRKVIQPDYRIHCLMDVG